MEKSNMHCGIIEWQVMTETETRPIMGVHWSAGLRDNLPCFVKITS